MNLAFNGLAGQHCPMKSTTVFCSNRKTLSHNGYLNWMVFWPQEKNCRLMA